MQIPNADENNIVQDLYCVCLRIKEFIHLTKNACNRTVIDILPMSYHTVHSRER